MCLLQLSRVSSDVLMTPLEDSQLLPADVSDGWTTRGETASSTLFLTIENTLDIHPPAAAAAPCGALPGVGSLLAENIFTLLSRSRSLAAQLPLFVRLPSSSA